MKVKKRYVCNECGYVSSSWIGKCPECLSWNSFVEEVSTDLPKYLVKKEKADLILNVDTLEEENSFLLKTRNERINNFFGDGITSGSVILLTGEPGVGKSTFLLFLTSILESYKKKYYFSGEESVSQIKKRVNRLKLKDINLYVSNENNVEKIIEICKRDKPDIVFIDSIQTCFSSNVDTVIGTVSQIKYSSSLLVQFAKAYSIPIIITGHVTKSGEIAGPKIMEHMVDVVVYFESEFNFSYRIIRCLKNRYGSIDDILIFELHDEGIRLIEDISNCFIQKNNNECIGKSKTVLIEGRYPIICEVEALVVPTIYSMPRRFSEGVDSSRIARIAAILDKHVNEKLNNYDIYFNISGGIKTKDVGIDLAVAIAIYSSKNKLGIDNNIAIMGELSLTGEVRNIIKLDHRIKEANRLGIEEIYIPDVDIRNDKSFLHKVKDINSAIKQVFIKKS